MFESDGSAGPAVAAKEAVAAAHAALDALAGTELVGLGEDDLAALVEDLYRLDARLTRERCRVLDRFDTEEVWQPSGALTPGAWLEVRTRISKPRAASELRLARRLASMPATDAALGRGEITVDAARVLGRCAAGRTAEAFPDAEESLLAHARTLRFADFERVARYWEQVVDPDGADQAARDRYERRRVHCSQLPDGSWRLDGNLDVLGGTELATGLRTIYDELLAEDLRQLREQHGQDASLHLLARTPAQRRADALVEMARRSAAAVPGSRLPSPLVTVHVGYETFAGPVLETLNRTVIAPWDLARILDEADIERVVFDGPSRVIDVGATRRFFTGATRRAIQVRDRVCTHPYCDRPYDECQIDHTVPFSRGGPTLQANGRPRCGPHNPEVAGGRPTQPSPEGAPDHHDDEAEDP